MCRVAITAAGVALVLLSCGCVRPPDVVQDVNKYASCLKSPRQELTAHFPRDPQIKDGDPVFSYYPGFLQGGAHLQLRVRLVPAEVAKLTKETASKTKHIYQGGSIFSHHNQNQKNNLPTASFHTARSGEDGYEFPSHFKLYVLGAKEGSDGSWNHGSTFGIAMSEETNEAIYWAEDW